MSRKLDLFDRIQLEEPVALNLRGAVYTSQRDYDKATLYFNKAIHAAPGYFAPRFNLGEVLFQQQHYAEARAKFEELTENDKGSELLQFKIFLTYLMEGDKDHARIRMDQMKFPSDTPAYYFARASWAFRAGNPAEGRDWIESSMRIFGPERNEFFVESLSDLGWISKDQYRNTNAEIPGS